MSEIHSQVGWQPDLSTVPDDDLLREQIRRAVGESKAGNDRHTEIARRMSRMACVFMAEMKKAEAATDTAELYKEVRGGGRFGGSRSVREACPVWIISDKKYGGGSLTARDSGLNGRLVIRGDDGTLARVCWVRKIGSKLVFPSLMVTSEGDTALEPSQYINRDAADSSESVERIIGQFMADINDASARYTRKPFEPYKLR